MMLLMMFYAVAVHGRQFVNVALNRPTYMSSVWSDNGFMFRGKFANDGNHATDLHTGPCAHTKHETNPWWAVDLLVSLHVAGVKFTNRHQSCTSADTTQTSCSLLWFHITCHCFTLHAIVFLFVFKDTSLVVPISLLDLLRHPA